MNDSLGLKKDHLRNSLLLQRKNLAKTKAVELSVLISKKVLTVKKFKTGRNFLVYLPLGNEVDTKFLINYLIQNRKKIFVSAYFENRWVICAFGGLADLIKNRFQTLQPKKTIRVDSREIDVALIPGVAFSKKGVRLGFGKGVYDKLLSDFKGLKIGLAYDFQILDFVPCEQHDLAMDLLVSEKRVIDLGTI